MTEYIFSPLNEVTDLSFHYLDSAHGVYIPSVFASMVNRDLILPDTYPSTEDWETIEKGPHDNEYYFEVWHSIVDTLRFDVGGGEEATLHHSDGLFFILDWTTITCPDRRFQLFGAIVDYSYSIDGYLSDIMDFSARFLSGETSDTDKRDREQFIDQIIEEVIYG